MLSLLFLFACTDKSDSSDDTEDTSVQQESICHLLPEGQVSLPDDEAAHDEDLEWWYYTGHLQDDIGNWYGFEHVFFLFKYSNVTALMAHHALTDVSAQTFEYDVQYEVYTGEPAEMGFNFLLGDHGITGGGGTDALFGMTENYALDLQLRNTKAPVFQHGDGYHDYNFDGYTYYYSRPRMTASGTIFQDGQETPVSGMAWFDHQWGALSEATLVGWDWFALQLDDGRDIMLFNLRESGGDNLVGGSSTDALCYSSDLDPADVTITPTGSWESPNSGCTYPMGWEITVGDEVFTVSPVMEDQELVHTSKTYWEGAATVAGDATGRAYVELTEYCE